VGFLYINLQDDWLSCKATHGKIQGKLLTSDEILFTLEKSGLCMTLHVRVGDNNVLECQRHEVKAQYAPNEYGCGFPTMGCG